MYLECLKLRNFRSCDDTAIWFREDLTILAGENNSGKTNVLDALRLLTSVSDGRRTRFPEREDVRLGTSGFELEGVFAELDPSERGLFFSALRDHASTEAIFGLSWEPPQGNERRRPSRTWVGPRKSGEVEPEVRELIRHVHLPALRDAARELTSGSPGRIEFLLRHVIGDDQKQHKEFLSTARSAHETVEKHDVITGTVTRVRDTLDPLTDGFHSHSAHLRFAPPTLVGIARELRFHLSEYGINPEEFLDPGLGYANLLYLASVLVELKAASDAELTLLLLEEPEAHLHPQLQTATLQFLLDRSKKSARLDHPVGEHAGRVQVIVTTHSPNLTASVSAEHVVVLRSCLPQTTTPPTPPLPHHMGASAAASVPEVSAQSGGTKTNVPGAPSETATNAMAEKPNESEATPPVRVTRAVEVWRLQLPDEDLRKVDRYLDVTRSALLYGQRVMLIEGIAEALLMPELAKILFGSDEQRMRRFRSASVIAIDGVDFAPYVRLLLGKSESHDFRIADRVAVITDEDRATPKANGQEEDVASDGYERKNSLEEIASSISARDRLQVYVTPNTFEAALFPSEGSNQDRITVTQCILKDAFVSLKPGACREKTWADRIEPLPLIERGAEFIKLLKVQRREKVISRRRSQQESEERVIGLWSRTTFKMRCTGSSMADVERLVAELTCEQQAVVNHVVDRGGNAVVVACPGAGKTKLVITVSAKCASTLFPRQGVLLVSFSNAACDEVRERLVTDNLGHLRRTPNFIGTFDSFLARFVIGPGGSPFCSSDTPVQYRDSWGSFDGVPVPTGRKTKEGKREIWHVPLDAFQLQPNGSARLTPRGVQDFLLRRFLEELPDEQRRFAEASAARSFKTILGRGFLDPRTARVGSWKRLEDARVAGAIGGALAARFKLAIIDEAQDSNADDLKIIDHFRN